MSQSTPFSPSNWAVNQAQQFFNIAPSDPFFIKGTKFAASTLVHTFLTVAALVETIVFAILTLAASPLCLHSNTAELFRSLATRTTLAATTAQHAAKGIVGYSYKTPLTEVNPEQDDQTLDSEDEMNGDSYEQKPSTLDILYGMSVLVVLSLILYQLRQIRINSLNFHRLK